MLEMKPACENCHRSLAIDSPDAVICSYECTFCTTCANEEFKSVCPNCGGSFSPRPPRQPSAPGEPAQ